MEERSREAAEWEELERQQLLSTLSDREQMQYGRLVQGHSAGLDQTCPSCGASDLWWYTETGWICQCAADGRGRRLSAVEHKAAAQWPPRQKMQPVKQRRLSEDEESESSDLGRKQQ